MVCLAHRITDRSDVESPFSKLSALRVSQDRPGIGTEPLLGELAIYLLDHFVSDVTTHHPGATAGQRLETLARAGDHEGVPAGYVTEGVVIRRECALEQVV